MGLFDSLGNVTLYSKVKSLLVSGSYPSSGELASLRNSYIDKGQPGITFRAELSALIGAYVTPILKDDVACDVPPGFPVYLPRPYYTSDQRIVLKPVPMRQDPTNQDVVWLMVALQSAINEYSRRPYPINWQYKEQSAFTHIYATLRADDTVFNLLFFKFYNYAVEPDFSGQIIGQLLLSKMLTLIPGGALIGQTVGTIGQLLFGSSPPVVPEEAQPGSGVNEGNGSAEGAGGFSMETSMPYLLLAAAGLILFADGDS